MLLPGTEMHIVTFLFICIETVIFFYLAIYAMARPSDKLTFLNLLLIFLLITYNLTGGLLPDSSLPGSYFIQVSIAYATGFIVPCYFPYYVYKAFGLEKIRFHAFKGVYLCLMLPYLLFVLTFELSGNLQTAKDLLAIPVLYALWVIYDLFKAIQYKYGNSLHSRESKEEIGVLVLSITPWAGLPIIDYFNLGQAAEATITNTGFLLLLALQLKRNIKELRIEQERLVASELRLLDWNTSLQREVEKRTKELELINEQKTNTFVNLAHETKTPLTLINNYLEEYINNNGITEERMIIKKGIEKLFNDITNLFDIERFNKGLTVYNHNQVVNFSQMLKESLPLFNHYSKKKGINLEAVIEDGILIKADPLSINRIINNLVDNAIKFSCVGCKVAISLQIIDSIVIFSVEDDGVGISPQMHKKVFEPYYQITNLKTSAQGMGLGLPIVKKVVEGLGGTVEIDSNPQLRTGTKITVILNKPLLSGCEPISPAITAINRAMDVEEILIDESIYDENKQTILVVEDNTTMTQYLVNKLKGQYNVYAALNGSEALKKLKGLKVLPHLIISDIMMDKLDGYAFARIISNDPALNHIPFLFLSAKSTGADRLQALQSGAIDFIQKPFSIRELTQKITSILTHAGRQRQAVIHAAFNTVNLPGDTRHRVSDHFDQNCKRYNLTIRERDIARLICEGYKYKDIGTTLFIAERTVTKHVQNIFEKLQVSNKIELVNKLEA